MITERVEHTYQFKRGTAERLAEVNPILAEGEPAFETNTYKQKIGDGFTPYKALPYTGEGGSFPPTPIVPESAQADWEQNDSTQPDYIKNRTHYVADAIHPDIEWDGNPEGKTYFIVVQDDGIAGYYAKVSDKISTREEMLETEIIVKAGEEIYSGILSEKIPWEEIPGAVLLDYSILIINNVQEFKNVIVQDGIILPSDLSEGLYLYGEKSGTEPLFYISNINFPQDIQEIDKKFLPNSNITNSVCENSLAQTTSQAGVKGFKIHGVSISGGEEHSGAGPSVINGALINVDPRALEYYEVGDVINYDAQKHWYNRLYIKEINTSSNQILIDTLDSKVLEITAANMELGPDDTDNWIWVAGKNVGTPIDQYVGAFAAGYESVAAGYGAFAAGRQTEAIGNYSTALGRQTKANYASMAIGLKTHALGQQSLAGGSNAQAIGNTSLSFGANTKTTNQCAVALGAGTEANGLYSFAMGNQTKANAHNQFAVGKFNNPQPDTYFEVGMGYDDNSRKNAFEVYHDGVAVLPQSTAGNIAKHGNKAVATLEVLEQIGTELVEQINTDINTKISNVQTDTNTKINNMQKDIINRKTAKGEIIELYDIDNRDTIKLTSTVTDNYFYKENFLKEINGNGYIQLNGSEYPIITTSNGTACRVIRHNYSALVNYKTACLIFTTPANEEVTNFTLSSAYGGSTTITTTKPLKSSNQYFIILKLSTEAQEEEGAPGNVYNITPTYIVDYEDSYHWIKGAEAKGIPFPNCIMIPHIGRIDKNDTLTAEWTASEQYKNAVIKVERANATNPLAYEYKQESVPYLYGRYGAPNADGTYTETEGLIKGSIGGIKVLIREQIDKDLASGDINADTAAQYKKDVNTGLIPKKYNYMLDVHTIPIRDGNCAIPVGMHTWEEDEEGNIIENTDELWYSAAAPAHWVVNSIQYGKFVPIGRGFDNPNHDGVRGWDTGLQQNLEAKYRSGISIREKNPNAATLIDEFNAEILTNTELTKLNADEKQNIGALGLYTASFGGCSSAQGKRAFATGTNTIAIGKYSHTEGSNTVTLGTSTHAEGAGTTAYGEGAHSEGGSTIAFGKYAHAGGSQSIAYGDASFAHGTGAKAIGLYSAAFGNQTIAANNNQFVVGKFNNIDTVTPDEDFFVVGTGSKEADRFNSFVVGRSISTGEAYIKVGNTTLTEAKLNEISNNTAIKLRDSVTNKLYTITMVNGTLTAEEVTE